MGLENVVEADDGTTAWEILNKDSIDFIVSDWNMPQMTGIELLRKVRSSEEYADIPFLMVTAEAQQENIIEAVQAKVSNYIVKPFTPDTMREKIDRIFPSITLFIQKYAKRRPNSGRRFLFLSPVPFHLSFPIVTFNKLSFCRISIVCAYYKFI